MRDLLKAAAKTGSGSIATLLLGAVAMKLMAVTVGPAGVGIFSLLRQTQQTASIAGSFGGQTPLVQALASRAPDERGEYVTAVLAYFLIASLSISALLVALAPWLGPALLGTELQSAPALIAWTALPSLAGVAVAFFSGILNGHRALGRLAIVQAVAAALLAALAYPLSRVARSGHHWAFIVLLFAPLCASALYAARVAARNGWLPSLGISWAGLHRSPAARHFLPFAGTTLVVNILGTGVVLTVRALVRRNQGLTGAGVFDVAWTFSMMYVMVVLNSLSTYYLPTLSGTQRAAARVDLMRQMVRFAVIAMVPLVAAVIVLRPLVIRVLYSAEFLPSIHTMRWMLLGDYFKVTGWILAMPMLAFPNMRAFFWSEVIANGTFLLLTGLGLFLWHDVDGIGAAFFVNYVLYLAFTYWYAHTRHGFTPGRGLLTAWLAGFVILGALSAWSWTSVRVEPVTTLVATIVTVAFAWLVLPRSERDHFLARLSRRRGR